MNKFLISTALLALPLLSISQSRAKVTQAVEWFGTTTSIKLTPQFGLLLDGQYRFAKSFDNMQHQFRIAPEFYVNNKLTVSPIAYVHIWNFVYGDQPSSYKNNEHRFFQEIRYKYAKGKFQFIHRFRTEQRFIQVHSKVDAQQPNPEPSIDQWYDKNVEFRIRHRAWMNYALNHDKMEPKTWYVPAFVEAFMSWGNPQYITYEGKIDQLRLFTGIGYQINKNANIQLGPYYQMLIKAKGDKQENNVGTFLQFNWNFDFSKPVEVK